MNKPFVSVLVPCYNHEKYIRLTIDSLLNQTYENFEIVVLDDCSTDNSFNILKEYEDTRLRLLKNSVNLGTVKTLNKLLECADGDFVAFCGSDDLWKEDKLQKQIDYLLINKCGICFSYAAVIDDDGRMANNSLNNHEMFNNDIFKNKCFDIKELSFLLLKEGNFLCHSSALIEKDIINNIGNFNTLLRQLHDFDYWLRILLTNNLHVLEEELVYYRRLLIDNNSVSASNKDNNIRLYNERSYVINNFIKQLSDERFNLLYGDINFSENFYVENIDAKKFLFLYYLGKITNDFAASWLFLSNNFDNLPMFDELDKCGFIPEEFYAYSSKMLQLYPAEYYDYFSEIAKNNAHLTEIIRALEQKINEYENSNSWKITRPLRKIFGSSK